MTEDDNLHGEVKRYRRGPKLRLFNQLPPRLAFPLVQLAPLSALTAGHIFLGFSKCGQFLLSYTHSCDTDEVTLQMTHRYRLHWWLVVPYAPLRKVAEVMLFGDQDLQEYSYDYLSITICQWPNDLSKILVYGCSVVEEGEQAGGTSNRRCYLTITAVPALNSCSACFQVAASYEEEVRHAITSKSTTDGRASQRTLQSNLDSDAESTYLPSEVAERWNSCIRLSCLQHGYTVHTSFEMVPPHPRFLPSVQLKYHDWVVLNAGNFIHVLQVSLENTNRPAALVSCNWGALYQGRLGSLGASRAYGDGTDQGQPTTAAGQRLYGFNGDQGPSNAGAQRVYVDAAELEYSPAANIVGQRGYEDNNSGQRQAGTSAGSAVGVEGSTSVAGPPNPAIGSNNDISARVSVRHCNANDEGDTGESSSSDTELESGSSKRPQIDRRVLTEADRDREWEILISNVPPRTFLGSVDNMNAAIDTDSASDVEMCANDSSGLSDSSTCTVKDISVRFDLLKHSDIKADNFMDSGNSRSIYPRNFGLSSVNTRSKAIQRLNSPQSQGIITCSPSHPSPSAYVVSSNDDSNDSTICVMQCEDLTPLEREHSAPSNGSSSHRFTVPCDDPTSTSSKKVPVTAGMSNVVTRFTRSRSEDSQSEHEENVTRLRSRVLPRHSSENTRGSNSPSNPAENEYEFIDEIVGSRHEKLSVFRKRRLADKKYEFSDENSENVPANYRSFRSQSSRHPSLGDFSSVLVVPSPAVSPRDFTPRSGVAGLDGPNTSGTDVPGGLIRSVYERLLSPASGMASPSDVLRPINQNISSPILSPRDDRWSSDWDRYEKSGVQRWGSRESLSLLGVSPSHPASRPNHLPASAIPLATPSATDPDALQSLNCVVDINRCYIEVDDELVSIITDIEDDELSGCTGYHNALPLEVHGAGYTQMHMISNTKAEKLLIPCVRVRQLSLDVEQFCHDTAHTLCRDANKRYSCCSDYNVEIVDVCSNTGNIVAVASVLVQADNLPTATPPPASTTTTTTTPTTSPPKTRSSKRNTSGGGHNSSSAGGFFAGGGGGTTVGDCYAEGVRKLYKASSTFVFSIETKEHYVIDKQPLLEEDPFHLTCHDVCGRSCEERWWWQAGSKLARQLRSLTSYPTSYYSSVKVLTNQPFLRGNSLTHIMEGQHLMAIVLGPIPGVEH